MQTDVEQKKPHYYKEIYDNGKNTKQGGLLYLICLYLAVKVLLMITKVAWLDIRRLLPWINDLLIMCLAIRICMVLEVYCSIQEEGCHCNILPNKNCKCYQLNALGTYVKIWT